MDKTWFSELSDKRVHANFIMILIVICNIARSTKVWCMKTCGGDLNNLITFMPTGVSFSTALIDPE